MEGIKQQLERGRVLVEHQVKAGRVQDHHLVNQL